MPLTTHVTTNLVNTACFVHLLFEFDVPRSRFFFGSFDVTNLYGSVPIVGELNVFGVVGDFFDQHRERTRLRNIAVSDLVGLIRLAINSDIICADGDYFTQINGLAMGNSLSPVLAIIYMYFVELRIFALLEDKILFWKRYVDDIFVISTVPLEEILPVINQINSSIKFTVELPVNNTMPLFRHVSVLSERNFQNCSLC